MSRSPKTRMTGTGNGDCEFSSIDSFHVQGHTAVTPAASRDLATCGITVETNISARSRDAFRPLLGNLCIKRFARLEEEVAPILFPASPAAFYGQLREHSSFWETATGDLVRSRLPPRRRQRSGLRINPSYQ
jgi:hypothetical protein